MVVWEEGYPRAFPQGKDVQHNGHPLRQANYYAEAQDDDGDTLSDASAVVLYSWTCFPRENWQASKREGSLIFCVPNLFVVELEVDPPAGAGNITLRAVLRKSKNS